jgi:hypothetical protein
MRSVTGRENTDRASESGWRQRHAERDQSELPPEVPGTAAAAAGTAAVQNTAEENTASAERLRELRTDSFASPNTVPAAAGSNLGPEARIPEERILEGIPQQVGGTAVGLRIELA